MKKQSRLIVCVALGLGLAGSACSNFVRADRNKVPDDLYHPTPTPDAGSSSTDAAVDMVEPDTGSDDSGPGTAADSGTDTSTTDGLEVDGGLADATEADAG